MSTPLAKQIFVRMKAKNLSIASLEREAGVSAHSVQNILRGKSKKPNAEIVQALADVLGCTVRDLLKKDDLFREENADSPKERLNNTLDYPDLLLEIVGWVNNKGRQENKRLTIKQTMTCIEEIYLYSLEKDPTKMDQDFAEWFFDLVMN